MAAARHLPRVSHCGNPAQCAETPRANLELNLLKSSALTYVVPLGIGHAEWKVGAGLD